jgi:hypothetical protein
MGLPGGELLVDGGQRLAEPQGAGVQVERLVQAQVHASDGSGIQPARLAVLAAVVGQVVVELLEVEGSERADGMLAKIGADVVSEQLAVAADGSQPEGLVRL